MREESGLPRRRAERENGARRDVYTLLFSVGFLF